MDQKALFMSTIADGRDVEYLTNWWRYAWKIIIFSKVFIFPGNPWTALWFRHLFAQKKEAAEGLGANPTDRGRSGTKIHLHVDQEGTPLGVIVVGANVHDSRLVGLTIENNSDLISMFNIASIAITYAWTRAMIIHVYMKKCIHMGLNRISVPEGRKKLRSKKVFIPLAAGS